MKHLPLFYYPSTWVWVDDDKTLLSTMEMTFSRYNTVKAFNTPNDSLDYLKAYQAPSAAFSFLQHNIHDEDYNVMHRTPMNFDVASIVSLLDNPHRHSEITAMVIDYNMPQMSGFELAKQTKQLAIPRILLTGNREENKAIEGFNDGLIERFIQKAEPDMVYKLTEYLEELTYAYFQRLSTPLLSYLQAAGKMALSDPTFIDFFETFCDEHDIKEYYLIDKNGSYLCINGEGQKQYLIVHTEKSLKNWLEVNNEYSDILNDEFQKVQNFKSIPFFGIGKEGWQFDPIEWKHYIYPCNSLAGREIYFWTKISTIIDN